jgi:hypothetical protein
MMFDPNAFVLGTVIARKEKVKGAAATQAGVLMGVGGMSPVGVLLAQSSIRSALRRQRASEAATSVGGGASTPPPTPQPTPTASGTPSWPTPTPTPAPVGITADDLKAGLAEGFAQLGKQMDAQNAKLLAAIASLAASIEAQNAANAGTKKSAS